MDETKPEDELRGVDPEGEDFEYDECATCGCSCEGCSEQVRDRDCEDADGCAFCLCVPSAT